MSLADAQYVAAVVDSARDSFISQSETELQRFYEQAAGILVGAAPGETRARLGAAGEALLLALVGFWLSALNGSLAQAHARLGLGAFVPYSQEEGEAVMRSGVQALLSAALLTLRTNSATRQNITAAWKRQYERGGAFTALRGAMRGATAGTFNTLVNASLLDAAKADKDNWELQSYNPLDEKTGTLDRSLVLNTGTPIITARGRTVRSIPGKVGRYTTANAWVPGPPRIGGDTHNGCRCILLPERKT